MTIARAHLPADPAGWLDLYLDDLLDGAARAEFEALLARQPQLADEVRLQRRIDGELRAGLGEAPPATRGAALRADSGVPLGSARTVITSQAFRAFDDAQSSPARATVLTRWRPYLLAAALVLAALGAWQYGPFQPEVKYIEPAELYARLKAGGFKPEFECKDDAEFAGAVRKRLGSALALGARDGTQLVGWAYGNTYTGRLIGPDTLVLMARLDGKHDVVVLMDKASSDRRLMSPPDPSLMMFRRVLGPFVLYEITPLGQPRLLENFRVP